MIILHSIWMMSLFWLLPTATKASSESEKWSWPSSPKENQNADSRRDFYYENVNDKSGRIRVPTTYYDNNRRPVVSQQYQVKEPAALSATNRPSKPLSDEFSDESFGEAGNNINGFYHNRFPNRFGSQQQQHAPNDYAGQFGQQFYPGAGGSQFGGGFPHQQGFNQGGFGGQQFPFQQGGNFGGYQGNNPSNGILVGPGGPTGIIGRPYGRFPGNQGGFGNYGGFGGNQYPQQGIHNQFGAGAGGFPFQQGGFDGAQNGINPHFGNGGGAGGGYSPYFQGNSFGSPSYGYGGGGNQQPFYDSTSKNTSGAVGNKKKVEKSAK